ncbi:MAG TPA: thymidylate kinase [Candidatus Sulfotelmatobacter sp.]
MKRAQPLKIISFSGIDGAGKSTQINSLHIYLGDAGQKTRLLAFWDDVVAWRIARESASRKAFGGDDGVGSPEKPVNRRDKNVQSPFLTSVRFCFYLADAVRLRRVVSQLQNTDADVVIFDRYIYDELANLPLERWIHRTFARLLLKISPTPDAAFLIDADPVAARTRKPEYPLEFLRKNREAYLLLAQICSKMTVISPADIPEMENRVKAALSPRLEPEGSDRLNLATQP